MYRSNIPDMLCLAAGLLLGVTPVLAEERTAQQQIERLQRQVDSLESRLQALESRMDAGVPVNRALQVEPRPGGWRNAANWGLLAKGMDGYEVERILGEPDNTKTVRKFEYWLYGDGRARLYLGRLKSWDVPSQAAR